MAFFNLYTESARQSLLFAQQEAIDGSYPSIEVPHLAIGILNERDRLGNGPALTTVNVNELRQELRNLISARKLPGHVESAPENVRLSPEANAVLLKAASEALTGWGGHRIAPRQLLNAIRKDQASPTAELLLKHEVQESLWADSPELRGVGSNFPSGLRRYLPTGCVGLDHLLNGGIPLNPDRTTVVCCTGNDRLAALVLGIQVCIATIDFGGKALLQTEDGRLLREALQLWHIDAPLTSTARISVEIRPYFETIELVLGPFANLVEEEILELPRQAAVGGESQLKCVVFDAGSVALDRVVAASIQSVQGIAYAFDASGSSPLRLAADVKFDFERLQPSTGTFEVTRCRTRREELGKVPFTLEHVGDHPPIQIGLSWRGRLTDRLARSKLYKYDVALSFAGEDRPYVSEVAKALKGLDIRVFYDEFEESRLWGKDLATVFGDVYARQAAFCVMFISEAYARKAWTNHERRFAIQAMIERTDREYLLPARFDTTELPGLPNTINYVDLRSKTPEALATLIAKRIGVIIDPTDSSFLEV